MSDHYRIVDIQNQLEDSDLGNWTHVVIFDEDAINGPQVSRHLTDADAVAWHKQQYEANNWRLYKRGSTTMLHRFFRLDHDDGDQAAGFGDKLIT